MVKGGWGRVVWMPTFDAENQVRDSKENRPFVPVAKNGELLPEVKQVIAIVKRHNLTLETGHSSPEEGLLIVREARKQGVEHVVVTHALTPPVRMSIAQMKEAAQLGAFIELVYGRMNAAEWAQCDSRSWAGAHHSFERPGAAQQSAASGRDWCCISRRSRRKASPTRRSI